MSTIACSLKSTVCPLSERGGVAPGWSTSTTSWTHRLGPPMPESNLSQRVCPQAPGLWLGRHLPDRTPRQPLPSPAVSKHLGDCFRDAVRNFGESTGIPVLHLNTVDFVLRKTKSTILLIAPRWDDPKVDHVRAHAKEATAPGVAAIVTAQEVPKVFLGYERPSKTGTPVGFDRADRRVEAYCL
jgi:hypothetical protein